MYTGTLDQYHMNVASYPGPSEPEGPGYEAIPHATAIAMCSFTSLFLSRNLETWADF